MAEKQLFLLQKISTPFPLKHSGRFEEFTSMACSEITFLPLATAFGTGWDKQEIDRMAGD